MCVHTYVCLSIYLMSGEQLRKTDIVDWRQYQEGAPSFGVPKEDPLIMSFEYRQADRVVGPPTKYSEQHNDFSFLDYSSQNSLASMAE